MKYIVFLIVTLLGCSATSTAQRTTTVPPQSTATDDDSQVVESGLSCEVDAGNSQQTCLQGRTVVLGCGCHGRVSFNHPLRSPVCCSGFARVEGCMGLCENGEVPWYSRCTQ